MGQHPVPADLRAEWEQVASKVLMVGARLWTVVGMLKLPDQLGATRARSVDSMATVPHPTSSGKAANCTW